jgi:hypothetical protein
LILLQSNLIFLQGMLQEIQSDFNCNQASCLYTKKSEVSGKAAAQI